MSSTISGSDLHRFINSGYLNGDSYLSRGVELKTPKSPHFHRPPNFSYSRNTPNYVTPHRANKRGLLFKFFVKIFVNLKNKILAFIKYHSLVINITNPHFL